MFFLLECIEKRTVDGAFLVYSVKSPLCFNDAQAGAISRVCESRSQASSQFLPYEGSSLNNLRGGGLLKPRVIQSETVSFSSGSISSSDFKLEYDITDAISVSRWVKSARTCEEARLLALSFARLLRACIDEGVMLGCLDCDIRHAFFLSEAYGFRFVALPIEGIVPDIQKLKALFVGAAGLIKPIDSRSQAFCRRWDDLFSPLANEPFNPQLYLELLDSLVNEALPQEGGVKATSANSTSSSMRTGRPTDVIPQDAAGSSAGDEPWAKGKHLRLDPGTAVLNTFDLELFAESGMAYLPIEEDRLSVAQSDSSAGHFATANEAYPPDTQVLNRVFVESAAPSASKRFELTRKRTSERFVISGNHFVVGKSKHSSFQVTDTTTVSRSHAIFACDSEGCWITDNDSKNGTFVNDRRLEPHKRELLMDGDSIRLSDELFAFKVNSSNAEGTGYAI